MMGIVVQYELAVQTPLTPNPGFGYGLHTGFVGFGFPHTDTHTDTHNMDSPCSPSARPASFPGTLCAPATPWRSLRGGGGGARGPGGASQRLPRRFELGASEVRWFSRSCVRGFHGAACAVLGFRAQRSRAAPWPGVAKYSCDLVVSRFPLTGSGLS